MAVNSSVIIVVILIMVFASCQCRIIKQDADLQSRLFNKDLNLHIKQLLHKIDECLQPIWKSLQQAKPPDRPKIKEKVQTFIKRRMIAAEKPKMPSAPNKPGKEDKTEKPDKAINIEDEGNNTSSSNSSSSSSESISDSSSSESYEDYVASTPTQEENAVYDTEDHGGALGRGETEEENLEKEEFFEIEPEKEDCEKPFQEDGVTEGI